MMDWQPRVSPNPRAAQGNLLTGRGIAYMRYKQAENYVALAMEVAVDRTTGKTTVRRVVCAHECGLIVNPDGLRNQVEGSIMQTLSRSLHEEVQFDTEKVTSVDWASHPTLTHLDAPERIDVVLVNGDPNPNRPDLPHYGAGETICKPLMAAVANAIYDATGVRLRRLPFRDARVLATLKASAVG
jgi:CO/xanthine dehydrogenase Mo-binding subunit